MNFGYTRINTIKVEGKRDDIPSVVSVRYDGDTYRCVTNVRGRPAQCFKCRKFGHFRRECTEVWCAACGELGHARRTPQNNEPTAVMVVAHKLDIQIDSAEAVIDREKEGEEMFEDAQRVNTDTQMVM